MKIVCLPLGAYQTNTYILYEEGASRCLIIDPGYEPEQITRYLDQLGLEPEAILLTHGHFDHVGGVKGIAEETGCKVYLHEEDLTLPNRLTLGTIPYTDHYGEGDTLALAGLSFRILHTPGHTPGGVCILCEDAMFSGDTLFAGTCGRTDFPGSSPKDMRTSLTRLAKLEGEYTVLPGHGEASTLSEEKRSNPYLQVMG